MVKRHIIAFDAGGTAVKAGLYDESGRECAVASVTMATLRPAPGFLERDPEAIWAAICVTTRKVLHAAAVAPSSIAVVGLTGYGNGLYLLDRNGEPARNGVLSTDHKLWAGKPLPLIAWLEKHEPNSLGRAARALMCKDYYRQMIILL
jgi:L-xylulokinase